jgi:hypothetical protein
MKFFISYANEDRQWAEWIAWELEAHGQVAVIQAWDFRPGGNFILEMQRAAAGSDCTVAVLSEDYLKSAFGAVEWAAALARDPSGLHRSLVPVRVRPCELTGVLGQVIYIDLVGLDPTAARNTLLNGLRADRAKPLSAPVFPGAGQEKTGSPVFPGSASASTAPAEEKPADIHVAIQFPQTVMGVDSMPIHFKFLAEDADTGARVIFTQSAFVVCNAAGSICDEFSFEFPKSGAYDEAVQIQAKESKDANHVVSVVCEDRAGRVLSRNSYIVRVIEPPVWWKWAAGVRALFSWGTSGGLGRLAILLSFVAIFGVYIANTTSVGKTVFGWFSSPVPDDLLPQGQTAPWGDGFTDAQESQKKWLLQPVAAPAFAQKYLQLDGPAAAYTRIDLRRGAFFSFDMSFTAKFLNGNTLEWLVRASPLPVGSAGPSQAYRFVLTTSRADSGMNYDLDGQQCSGTGLSKCEPMSTVPVSWFDDCAAPRQVHLIMRVTDANIAVKDRHISVADITVAGEAISLKVPAGCSKMIPFQARTFRGLTNKPDYPFGAVGFRVPAGQSVALQLVSIYALDQSTEAYFSSRR